MGGGSGLGIAGAEGLKLEKGKREAVLDVRLGLGLGLGLNLDFCLGLEWDFSTVCVCMFRRGWCSCLLTVGFLGVGREGALSILSCNLVNILYQVAKNQFVSNELILVILRSLSQPSKRRNAALYLRQLTVIIFSFA